MKFLDFRKTSKFRIEGLKRGHKIKNDGMGNKTNRAKVVNG